MGSATFSGNSNYVLNVDASLASQNKAGNYSTIYYKVSVSKTNSDGYWASTNTGNSGYATSSAGDLWSDGNMAYDFRTGTPNGTITIKEGYFNVKHRSDGNAEYYVNGGLNLTMLGKADAGTGWRSLPRIQTYSPPNAPKPGGWFDVTPTQIGFWFTSAGDNGAPILEWQVGYGRDKKAPWWIRSTSGPKDGSYLATGLDPSTTYYFWARGRNAAGWGPWSWVWEQKTPSGAKIKIGGVWKDAIPYVKSGGVWKVGEPYVKSGGVWKKGS